MRPTIGLTQAAVLFSAMSIGFGCAARSTLLAHQQAPMDLTPHTAVLVEVGSAVADEDIEQEIIKLRGALLSQLTLAAQYRTVALAETAQTPPADALLVSVTVTKLRRVSSAGRFWGGALAGRASLTADVRITRSADGQQLGLYTVTGESGGSGLSGGTDDAINKTAIAIASLLRKSPPPAASASAGR